MMTWRGTQFAVIAMFLPIVACRASVGAPAEAVKLQIRDFALGKDFIPVALAATGKAGGTEFRTESKELGLSCTVQFNKAKDRTVWRCEVEDQRGADRALTIACGMPLDAIGWQWWDDLETHRTIESGKSYSHSSSWAGLRDVSVYPFCALTGGGRGVGMAVDLTDPRVFRFRYDAAAKVLWTEVDLGIAKEGVKHPGKAGFAFSVFDFDPAWGFRAALQRYYEMFPGFAKRRAPEDGIWLLGLRPGTMADPWDFGFKFDEGAQSRAGYDVVHGIEPYVYTEPWGKYEHFGAHPTPDGKPRYGEKAPLLPVAELMKSILADVDQPENVRDKHFAAPRREVAQALKNSAITDPQGNWIFRHWTDEWSKGDWISNVTCNPDPDLPRPNRASLAWDAELWPAFKTAESKGGALKGIYLDSVASFMGFYDENFRRDQWQYADVPLVPSEATRGPAQLHAFACVEFAREVADEMGKRNDLVIANTFRPYMQYFTPLLDMIGAGETRNCGLAGDEHYRYLRTYAGTKPVSWMDYGFVNPDVSWEQKERGMKRCLCYAVHPGTGPFDNPARFEPSRPLFRRYEPLIIQLGQAGWQPMTEARVVASGAGAKEPPGVLVERYGTNADSVWFTLRNPSRDAREGNLQAQLPSALANAKDAVVWDALAGRPVADARISAAVKRAVIPFAIAADDTLVFRVATRDRLLQDAAASAKTWLSRFRSEADWLGRTATGVPANGDFEAGLSGWGTDERAGKHATITVSNVQPLDGKRSLRIVSAGNDAFAAPSQSTPLRGGTKYTLSFSYRWTRPEGAAGTIVPRFGVKDAAGKWLSNDYIYFRDLQPTGGRVEKFTREFTPVAATVDGFFQFLCSGAFGTFEVDDVVLRAETVKSTREMIDQATASLTRCGAEKVLAETVAHTPANAASLTAVVESLTNLVTQVERDTSDEHLRRCLAMPLQEAALATSAAEQVAARIYVTAPVFPAAVAGDTAQLRLETWNVSNLKISAWNVTTPGTAAVTAAGSVAPAGHGSAIVPAAIPASCPWGWHDVLLQSVLTVGGQRLTLLNRVTVRAEPALTLAPLSTAASTVDGAIRVRITNRTAAKVLGKLKLVSLRGRGKAQSESLISVKAASTIDIMMQVAPGDEDVLAEPAHVAISFDTGQCTAEWSGDVFLVPGAVCPVARLAPLLDGTPDEPAWRQAEALSAFVLNTAPQPPVHATTVRVCHDATKLYIAFICHGDTGKLRATHTQRDGDLWLDDAVEVFLDPAGERKDYFHFVVNAAGARYDARCLSGGIDKGWNGDWTAKVSRTADAWTAEIAIPFATLGGEPTGSWSANFARDDAESGQASEWACTYGGFHTPARFGELRLE